MRILQIARCSVMVLFIRRGTRAVHRRRGKYHRCAQTRRLRNRREKERPKVERGEGGRKARARARGGRVRRGRQK